jgi:hypothetical protein
MINTIYLFAYRWRNSNKTGRPTSLECHSFSSLSLSPSLSLLVPQPCMVRYSLHTGAFKEPGAHVHKLDLDTIPAYYKAGTVIALKLSQETAEKVGLYLYLDILQYLIYIYITTIIIYGGEQSNAFQWDLSVFWMVAGGRWFHWNPEYAEALPAWVWTVGNQWFIVGSDHFSRIL